VTVDLPVLSLDALDVARLLGAAALLLPIAALAARFAGGRRVEGYTIAVGVAAAAAVVALLGVAISFPTDLGAGVWLVAIVAVDAVAILALILLRRPRAERDRSPARLSAAISGLAHQWVALLIGALALAVTVAAVAIASDSATQTRRETTFTQLWMLPTKSGRSATLGIRNLEGAPRTYRLRVASAGRPLLSRLIRVPSGATRSTRVGLPLTRLPRRITATASAVGSPGERRTVDVWTHAPS
jgi:hypothetical protein